MKSLRKNLVLSCIAAMAVTASAWATQGAQGQNTPMKTDQEASQKSQRTNKQRIAQGDSIQVVGHLALPGALVSNIRTTEDQTRPLLEVTDKKNHLLNLLDVSDASQPRIVQQMQKPATLENSRLEFEVGDAALFAETPDAASRPAPRSISIVSFADSEHPKAVRRFTNVTALTADHARGLIYLANPEGLWILQTHSLADRLAAQKQYDEMLRDALTP